MDKLIFITTLVILSLNGHAQCYSIGYSGQIDHLIPAQIDHPKLTV